ncbi:MAG: RIP metalloprotease RseP [Deltaproteobacteria bacterium CG_4_10_14_3_um_filter_60_8]|nr:MAG: RIP metalloprotease RseP [Desulfobacterales bacterium CG2_30_60_27]PIP44485.1 MAG: RIP metalloprotease RseP [Deltaproteobacteria bacterium CG23_combo_of_CG06-09_8_20_14_all_60_8]PIY20832.1 MAG: RIP metalloprotease RseP [Deltaproteobacteria bacterium CG_4_10_14_3_um_filter_60_8]
MHSILPFIILLGLLIFVHELGHFLVAKLFGVKILKFSLGFGPKLFGKQFGETEYLVSALPLGGYVKMLGEQLTEEVEPTELARSFAHKPIWQRFLIVASGPCFNLLFAVLVFFLIFAFTGLPHAKDGTTIGQVTAESPGASAGLKAGDVIMAINGQETTQWEEVSERIQNSGGGPVALTIKRGADILQLTGQPTVQENKNIFGEIVGTRLMLGITRTEEVDYEFVSPGQAFLAGLSQTWAFIYLTVMGLIKIIQRIVPASEIGGPILIAQLTGQQLTAGWINLMHFMGLLSVNLGVLNLLPIPVLDGGHLVFFSVEAILRRPLSMRTKELWQQVGLFILASLMIFVFYNDLMRIFGKS